MIKQQKEEFHFMKNNFLHGGTETQSFFPLDLRTFVTLCNDCFLYYCLSPFAFIHWPLDFLQSRQHSLNNPQKDS